MRTRYVRSTSVIRAHTLHPVERGPRSCAPFIQTCPPNMERVPSNSIHNQIARLCPLLGSVPKFAEQLQTVQLAVDAPNWFWFWCLEYGCWSCGDAVSRNTEHVFMTYSTFQMLHRDLCHRLAPIFVGQGSMFPIEVGRSDGRGRSLDNPSPSPSPFCSN